MFFLVDHEIKNDVEFQGCKMYDIILEMNLV